MLCKFKEETIYHLFISCSYAGIVYGIVKYKAMSLWKGDNLEDSVKNWYFEMLVTSFPCLPGLLVNNLWGACNLAVFKDTLVPPEVTTSVTLIQTSEFKVDPKEPKQRSPVFPEVHFGTLWGFFDEASQGHPPMCGVEVVIFFNQYHYIHIRYALGRGTTTLLNSFLYGLC